MFGNLDLSKEIKIPKGVVMMLKSFGLDAKELEANLLKLGTESISLLKSADVRLCSLANQHQLLHEEKQKLVAEVALLHQKFDKLLAKLTETETVREDQNGSNGNDSSSPEPAD